MALMLLLLVKLSSSTSSCVSLIVNRDRCDYNVSMFDIAHIPTLQPVFDPRLGSSAYEYCPCNFVVFREQLNSSGRCGDDIRNTTRTSLRGIAEAGQYVSVAVVVAACPETIPVIQNLARKSDKSRVLMLFNHVADATGRAGRDASRAWGKVFHELGGAVSHMRVFMVRGMRGNESHAALNATMGRLANLQLLSISDSDWHDPIPGTVRKLGHLRDLRANRNRRLVRLPVLGELGHLVHLTTLSLHGNRLTELHLPKSDTALHLLNLDVQDNELSQITALEKATALKKLYLGQNHLTVIPNLSKNTALLHIGVGNNRLRSPSAWPPPGGLPDSITFVRVAHNQLDDIPDWVQRLPGLEYVDASGNNISTFTVFKEGRDVGSRNSSLLLLGGNPVCGTNSSSGNREGEEVSPDGGRLTDLQSSSRWHVQCKSQCSATCPHSIPWGTIHSLLNDGVCHRACDVVSCGYDGGDCLSDKG